MVNDSLVNIMQYLGAVPGSAGIAGSAIDMAKILFKFQDNGLMKRVIV